MNSSKSERQLDENLRCDECGRFGAFDFAIQRLCAECYAEKGSCCAEFRESKPPESLSHREPAAQRPLKSKPNV